MSIHSHKHHHHTPNSKSNLAFAFWINTFFAILEIFGGLYTNSVAVLSDALHDLGDSLSLGLAYYFHRKSLQKKDKTYSYGYKRFSLLGALINSVVLITGSVFIIQEAIKRIAEPQEANAKGMLVLAAIGIGVNLLAMLRLKKGKSINERVVSLHFLEDVLGWVAVLIGSVVMLFYKVPVLDPILSMLIAAFILFNVYRNLREFFQIILQGTPLNVDVGEIKKKILSIPKIKNVHDIHTWTMDGEYNVMSIHIVIIQQTSIDDMDRIKQEVRHCLEHYHINHLTIETEIEGQVCAVDCL